MKISGIYAIVNTVNNKRYVGSSQNIKRRFSDHRSGLRRGDHRNLILQRAWDKYGEDKFTFVILEECEIDMLIIREQAHLDNGYDYNLSPVSDSPMRGRKHSSSTKEKQSLAHKNRDVESNKRRSEKISNALTGRVGYTPSAETRQKISDANRGKIRSDESRRKMSKANRGRKVSEETRKQMSERMKGKSHTIESRKKMAEKALGRTHTEETRRKLSQNHRPLPPEQEAKRREKLVQFNKNKTAEQKQEFSRKLRESKQKQSPEVKAEWLRKLAEAKQNRSAEAEAERRRKISQTLRKRREEQTA